MTSWEQRLSEKEILVADGAWGTELARRGLPAGEAPEKWNLENADAVREVAKSYIDAGADVIITNTFGGSRLKLAKVDMNDWVNDVNRRGAEISKAAAGDTALVFASAGPTGELMTPLGTVTEHEMVECFSEQIAALAEGGADGIVIETMAAINEAKAALRAAREVCSLPVVVSFTFDKGPAGYATFMGVKPEQAAEEMAKAGANVIGSNCGIGITDMVEIVRAMRGACDLPIWAKSNAGLPEYVDGQTVFKETPEQMAGSVAAIVEAGASFVGGCCGTTPDHIRLIAQECAKLRGNA